MQSLIRGEKVPLNGPVFQSSFRVVIQTDAPGLVLDGCCFGLDAAERLSDDRYMVFYNQPHSPEKAIRLTENAPGKLVFELNLGMLPAAIERLVFTLAIDGSQTMAALKRGSVTLGGQSPELEHVFVGSDFGSEKALMVLAIYRKSGIWRASPIGQGFVGGLSALLASFGGQEIAPSAPPPRPPPAPAPAAPTAKRLSLEKRIETEAPHLLSLTKKATLSLVKRGLENHRAKVALCLDISASMSDLFRAGKVQVLTDRVMALATRLDDDGELDVFLFGEEGHLVDPVKISNCGNYIAEMRRKYPLEGGTRYHRAMQLVREKYCGNHEERKSPLKQAQPVYVMFVTDGGTSNQESAINQLKWASYEPIFWQFMAIREKSSTSFSFLEKLDDLQGRFLDNADFFAVDDPVKMTDEQLYEKMMGEYPKWLEQAQNKNLLG